MKNCTRKHFLLLLLFFGSFITKVSSQETLYAITGASGANSILYKLNAATGAVVATIGSTGFTNVTALAISPVTGDIYGYSNPTYGTGGLIKIDPYTGQGTLVGGPSLQVPDMSFNSAGILYAWSEQADLDNDGYYLDNDDLYIIDINTGGATKVGECDCNTTSTGLAFTPSGGLFVKTGNTISKMDPNTGLMLSTVSLSSTTHNLLTFNSANQGYTGVRTAGKFTLQKIDPVTGVITTVGTNFTNLISAIAFGNPLPASVWYLDADGDHFAISSIVSTSQPGIGYTQTILPITDCDDADVYLNPLTVWYLDADGDKFAVQSTQSCTSPGDGYTRTVLPLTDCDDQNSALNPSTVWYLDADGDHFAVSTTNSCAYPGPGYTLTVLPLSDCDDSKLLYVDADGDGFGTGNPVPCGPAVNTNDCDDTRFLYKDADGDGFGAGAPTACGVITNSDCDDTNAAINPLNVWYRDVDGDNYAISTIRSCVNPGTGYTRNVLPLTDCNDNDATLNPLTVWYRDGDGDNYAVSTTQSCNPGTGYTRTVLPLTDCNDNDATLNPLTIWYRDADGDNYAISIIQSCTNPGTGYTRNELPITDCNDNDATLNPLTVWYRDADGDLFASSTIQSCNPGAGYTRTVLPVTDCDDTKFLYVDADADGFGSNIKAACGVANNLDCDDTKKLYNDADGDGFGSGAPTACGVANNTDNCPSIANATQKDLDSDGVGDACDLMLDICAAIANLTISVETYVDRTKDEDKLVERLEKALADIFNNKPHQAANDMNTFNNKISAKIGKTNGVTAEQAADLISQSNIIINALNSGAYTVPCDPTPGQINPDLMLVQQAPELLNKPFKVFPNANNGKFYVQVTSGSDSKADIFILDVKGSIVEKRSVHLTRPSQSFFFDLGSRSTGMYLAKVITKDGIQTAKIIVQK